ncbi:dGTP triphosphohydrolase [Bosea sp. BK604]|uniref:deoxyguanosinetriphosphate triphosphohydrolase family protein n=1 Tax=Bosea sp. BK604 TaxID=2512180 RepID=UPI0010D1B093|nr:dNTP triphosphohydrolase [Bosea sp. BK604]TCR65449.1 dGTPase [Bosea sp. BK604]
MGDLWCSERLDEWLGLKPRLENAPAKDADADEPDPEGWRSRFQQDYDRLLFSTPVRRLSDKTQVWPMDENDGVRTRLTHSHEVANLARSIGSRVAAISPGIFGDADLHEVIQPILSAIGLAHDLGNPPFGHQGETAMSNWFRKRDPWIFANARENGSGLPISVPVALRNEFLSFDGNPQSLRLITKLQTSVSNVGLNLTAATLAASLKYPVSASGRDKSRPIRKKVGYFHSEIEIVNWVRGATGLAEGQRHPLTWIMEACDDIAYSVLDVDDVMKKGIVSPDDVHAILKSDPKLGGISAIGRIQMSFDKVNASARRTEVVRDIKIGYLRAILIEALIKEASSAYVANCEAINALSHEQPLMDHSVLCKALKRIANQYAFSNSSVLRMEAFGAAAIDELMTFFWGAISDREDPDDMMSAPISARGKYGRSLISPNYVEDAVLAAKPLGEEGGLRYRELRLLTDMVSGMTDTFAIKLWEKIQQVPDVRSD